MFNNRIGLRIIEKWCDFIYKQAQRIVVISPGFRKALLDRGVPDDKIKIIYNWCPDENQIKPQNRDEALSGKLGLSNHFNVVFAGVIGKAQALDAVLDAAHLIAKELPVIQFVFVGDGPDGVRLRERAIKERLSNILFLPWCPIPEVARILAIADLALVHLKDEPLFEITIPGRTQAYMSAGKPILMGVKGDAAEIVRKAGAGIVCLPENPKSIADSIATLFKMPRIQLDAMGTNGREFYEKQLSLRKAVDEFENIFKLVVENKANGKKNI
jgi:glycosyltransferase involved in cell wall biosynthesis